MECDLLKEVKAALRSLVQTTIQKVTIDTLKREYYQMVGENIPYKFFGYSTLDTFLRSLNDTLLVVGFGDTAQVYVIANSKSRHIHDLVMQQKVTKSNKNKPLKVNAKIVSQLSMAQKNRGFSCVQSVNRNGFHKTSSTNKNDILDVKSFHSKLADTNNKEDFIIKDKEMLTNGEKIDINIEQTRTNEDHNKNLNKKDVYCNDAIPQWATNNAKNCVIHRSSNEEETLWNNNKKTITEDEKSERCVVNVEENIQSKEDVNVNMNEKNINYLADTTSEIVVDLDALSLDLAKNLEPYGTEIAPYNIAPNVEIGSIFRVIITEICNPSRFWFQIQEDSVDEIDILMDQIECYYNALNTKDLVMPQESMACGQICCAFRDGLWYRAEILTKPVNGAVKVFFVDYGTVDCIDVKSIKYLILPFTKLRCQALLGTLSHIKPVDTCWTTEAALCFKYLVIGSILWAKVIHTKEEGLVYCMVLCDNTKEKRLINKCLIRMGHALYTDK